MIRDEVKAAQEGVTRRMDILAWDFLKMLGAAILCGLAVSIAVAGIALLLTSSAEARPLQKATGAEMNADAKAADFDEPDLDDPSPTPGAILLGDGCGRTVLKAIERDWQVRIDGRQVEVRVMQTFQMPAESAEVATFFVQLMSGARMKSLSVQSSAGDWNGHMMGADEYDRLMPAAYLSLSRSQVLVSHSPRGAVMTGPFPALKPAELITIEYTYLIQVDAAGAGSTLTLPLDAADEYAMRRPSLDEPDAPLPSSSRSNTRGAVWVEWIGRKPARVTGLPVDADLELSGTQVAGFSWATRAIQSGARFQLAWAL